MNLKSFVKIYFKIFSLLIYDVFLDLYVAFCYNKSRIKKENFMKSFIKIFILAFVLPLIVCILIACSGNTNSNTNSSNNTSTNSSNNTNISTDTSSNINTNTSSNINSGVTGTDSDHIHEFLLKEIVEPTCKNDGYSLYACSCQATEKRDIKDTIDHDWYTKELVEATCQRFGEMISKCSLCGDEETTILEATDHEYIFVETIEPTCTDEGYDRYACSCAFEIHENVTPALNHIEGEWITSCLPTSVNDGSEYCECSRCFEEIIRPIPRVTLYYEYSVENGINILTISSSDKSIYSSVRVNPTISGDAVDGASVDKLILGENIVEVQSLSAFNMVENIVFSNDVSKINNYAIYHCESLNELYFEGDAPSVESNSLTLNGSASVTVAHSSDSQGFGNGLLFAGQPLKRYNISSEIPDMTINEFADKTAASSATLAKDIVELFEAKGHTDLLLLPYTINMAEFAEIKDFTLELTKDCQTDLEKANAIYDYIVTNIQYWDDALYYTPYEVFKENIAVCAGYVGLMHDMLVSVDIPAFYTRGMTLSGCSETVESIITEEYTFDTHAWITVYLSNGEVVFYDPTWGVSDYARYMEMDIEEIGDHAMTFEVDGLEVLIDEIDFSLLLGFQQFLYSDGNIYNSLNGTITKLSGTAVVNDWFIDTVQIKQGNGDEKYTDGEVQAIGTGMNNGFFFNSENIVSQFQFAAANGRIYHPYVIFNFLYTQASRYGKDITFNDSSLIFDNGIIYAINEDGTLSALSYIGSDENIIIPTSVGERTVISVNTGFLEYNTVVKSVVIEEGVTYVARFAFSKCTSLEYVYLPSTVVDKIHYQYIAFTDCINLHTIEVSQSNPYLTSVDGNLYSKDMKTILKFASSSSSAFTLPTSVETIAESAFHNAQLEYIVLHDNLKKIGDNAFAYSSLKEIVIPSGCEIGNSAFMYSQLRSVTINDGIETFGNMAFSNCQMLISVTLPSTLEKIPESAFSQTVSLYEIKIPSNVTVIEYDAFSYSGLTSITLSSSLVDVGSDAFFGCYSLYHINNLSPLVLTKGDGGYGELAKNALIITDYEQDCIEISNDFVIFNNYETGEAYITNYIGDGTNVVFPTDFMGHTEFKLSPYAFCASTSMKWISYSYVAPAWTNELNYYGKGTEIITVVPGCITYIPEYCFEGWTSLKQIRVPSTAPSWFGNVDVEPLGNAPIKNAVIVTYSD